MGVKLAVISLSAEDVEATAHFYRDVIGLKLAAVHLGHKPHFDLEGVFLVICQGKPQPAETNKLEPFPLVAFSVEDLSKAVQRLEQHRVNLPWGIEMDQSSRWVKFYDPAGNLVELVQCTD